jgi:hypothetical protein
MRRWPALVVAAVLIAFGYGGVPARAGLVPWSYSWARSPVFIADQHGTGGIAFTSEPWRRVAGPKTITASTLVAFSAAYHNRPDHIVNRGYRLTLTLRDEASRKAGVLYFTGVLNGTLSFDDVHLTNTFTGRRAQAIHLGQYWYSVTMGPFIAPVPRGPAHIDMGQIQAQISLRRNPEPSSLALAWLGSGVLGLAAWRRRTPKA